MAVVRALDAELTHPVAKGVGMDIQDSRRTLRPINHSTCLLKGGQYMASLDFFQGGQVLKVKKRPVEPPQPEFHAGSRLPSEAATGTRSLSNRRVGARR